MLRVNPDSGVFYLVDRDGKLAPSARKGGLDRSLSASARYKCAVFIAASSYAALPYYALGDARAKKDLWPLKKEYTLSYATAWQGEGHPSPPGRHFMPFQEAGIDYCLARIHALVGDEPGTGKTIEAIGVANAIGARRICVICPANARLQWQREIRLWSTIPRVSTYPILRSADGVSPFAHYIIVSYDLARQEEVFHALATLEFDLLVLDEAHYLKSVEARRTRAVFGFLGQRPPEPAGEGEGRDDVRGTPGLYSCLADRSAKVLALTGTPLPNRPRECYNLARHLAWDAIDWASEDVFTRRYNPSMQLPSGAIIEKKGHLPELRARLRCNFMVRRLKRKVLDQLPDEYYELTLVEPNGAIKKVIREENLLDIDPEHLEHVPSEKWGHISTLRRKMGEAMAPKVSEHVARLLDGGLGKVVVFAWHKTVISYLAESLGGYGVVVVTGATSPVQRQRRVDEYIADPRIRVFVGQTEAAGTALDGLQKVCFHAVLAEPSWVPKDMIQPVARLARHGQDSAVLAQFMVAVGSLGERIVKCNLLKTRDIHTTLDAD